MTQALNRKNEIEFNLRWAEAHPALFVERVADFCNRHRGDEWTHGMDVRGAFLTLTATRED